MTDTNTPAEAASKAPKSASGFSAEERAAIKERAQEVKAEARREKSSRKAEEEASAVLEKIAEMSDSDRQLAEQIHKIVTASAPNLAPKLWYGMPAYARDGKIVCFFQGAEKFKVRYATLGFNEDANLDDGNMWPTSFALTTLTEADEATIATLVERAAS